MCSVCVVETWCRVECTAWQVHERNSGRDPFPVFLKRGPLPREKPRGATLTGRIPKSLCYRPCDFRIGGYVNVHGRDFLLHDCDAFTREYYMVRCLLVVRWFSISSQRMGSKQWRVAAAVLEVYSSLILSRHEAVLTMLWRR